jgi:parallel beta-helix repeat protein
MSLTTLRAITVASAHQLLVPALMLATLLVWGPPAALAQFACGDTILSGGTVLVRDDIGPCPAPGPAWTIVGPVIVNLDGVTISCGAAITGIEVQGINARIEGGMVEDCQDGVVVDGDGEHELVKLTVGSPGSQVGDRGFRVRSDRNHLLGNLTDGFNGEGFRIDGDDNRAVANRATATANEGFRINGDGNELKGNRATENFNHGFRVGGNGNQLLSNQSAGNEGEGFRLDGNANHLVDNVAVDNFDEGYRIRDGQDNTLIRNLARGNGSSDNEAGIRVQQDGNTLRSNTFVSNFGDGILVVYDKDEGEAAENNTILDNVATGNGDTDLVDENPDCDNNQWSGNRFVTRSRDCIH